MGYQYFMVKIRTSMASSRREKNTNVIWRTVQNYEI